MRGSSRYAKGGEGTFTVREGGQRDRAMKYVSEERSLGGPRRGTCPPMLFVSLMYPVLARKCLFEVPYKTCPEMAKPAI